MPKMKTLASAKKRFKITGKGKVKFKQAYARHMMTNKPKSMKRKARGTAVMSDADAKIVLKSFMPYLRGKKKRNRTKAKTGEGS